MQRAWVSRDFAVASRYARSSYDKEMFSPDLEKLNLRLLCSAVWILMRTRCERMERGCWRLVVSARRARPWWALLRRRASALGSGVHVDIAFAARERVLAV